MEQYSLSEAKEHLTELIENAHQGKSVIILDQNKKMVRLVPVPSSGKPRRAGSARGQIKMSRDFDAPLSDFSECLK